LFQVEREAEEKRGKSSESIGVLLSHTVERATGRNLNRTAEAEEETTEVRQEESGC